MNVPADPRAVRSREAILVAARRLLLSEGPAAITHQRVAQQAGVGRATVYRHWPRPEQLLLDVMAGADMPFFREPEPKMLPRHADPRFTGPGRFLSAAQVSEFAAGS